MRNKTSLERLAEVEDVILRLENIKKSFDGVTVLNGIDLDVKRGEFITLLGSSGCGKTTTLRIIGGLETADEGRVILEGVDVTNEEPNKRNVNTVFQNYALFPHMNVEQNVGYSLKIRRRSKEDIKKAVSDALQMVQLEGYEKRMPNELSGGQRQRIAIARAIVNEPKVLLLDEPLGALDLKLRRQMQIELKRLQKRLGITFIYITHDQEEALNMSDRIAVMRNGVFEQLGTASDVYDRPRTSYVAEFVGSANIIRGTAKGSDENTVRFVNSCGTGEVSRNGAAIKDGEDVVTAVRSEHIDLCSPESGAKGLRGTVKEKSFSGGMLRIEVGLEDGTSVVSSRHGINADWVPGDAVIASWDPEKAVLVDLEG